MPDKLLLETYQKALYYEVDYAFVELLLNEMRRRDIYHLYDLQYLNVPNLDARHEATSHLV